MMNTKGQLEFDYKKAIQAINFFAKKEGGQISKLRVLKLIWLADRYHLRKYGRPILNDTYFAMPYGPVASAVKDITGFNFLDSCDLEQTYLMDYLTREAEYTIKSIKDVNTDVFSDSDIEALETISQEYGTSSTHDLIELSHKFPEWKKHEESLKSGLVSRESMSYEDFFKNPTGSVDGKNIFHEPQDQLETAQQIFEENAELSKCWI